MSAVIGAIAGQGLAGSLEPVAITGSMSATRPYRNSTGDHLTQNLHHAQGQHRLPKPDRLRAKSPRSEPNALSTETGKVHSSLKTERTARKVYSTRDEARADVFDHIERFSNPRRRHSKLGYISPMEFEARTIPA